MSAAAVILAAGRGARFAGDVAKPLASLRGRPLVAWALDAALASGLQPVLLVVPPAVPDLASMATDEVEVVVAEDAALGIAHSLRAAIDGVEGHADVSAICVGLGDQPRVGADAYRRLAAAHAGGADLAVAVYEGTRGNPVLIGRALWSEARRLSGDVGARALMGAHAVTEVDCTGTGDPHDVDTLDDLRALEEEIGRG